MGKLFTSISSGFAPDLQPHFLQVFLTFLLFELQHDEEVDDGQWHHVQEGIPLKDQDCQDNSEDVVNKGEKN